MKRDVTLLLFTPNKLNNISELGKIYNTLMPNITEQSLWLLTFWECTGVVDRKTSDVRRVSSTVASSHSYGDHVVYILVILDEAPSQ